MGKAAEKGMISLKHKQQQQQQQQQKQQPTTTTKEGTKRSVTMTREK